MTERRRDLFYSTFLGAPASVKVEKVEPEQTSNAGVEKYQKILDALTAEERTQLDRFEPFIRGVLDTIRGRFKTSDFLGARIEWDKISIRFPEETLPGVRTLLTQKFTDEHKLQIDAHNARIPKPGPARTDLHKLI